MGKILRDKYYENTQKQLQTQLTLSVDRIEQYLKTLQRDMVFMSNLDVMNDIFSQDVDRRISNLLETKKKELHLKGDFYLVDNQGVVVASSNTNALGAKNFSFTSFYAVNLFSPFNHQKIATLILDFSLENIKHFFKNTPSRSYFIELDNKRLYHTSNFINVIEVKQALDTPQKIVIVLEENEDVFLNELRQYENIFFVALMVGALVIGLIAYYFVDKLLKPIEDLSSLVEHITKTQNYAQSIVVKGKDEVAKLAKAFDTMLHGIVSALNENAKLTKEIEDTQREVVFTMGAIGESRSKETGNHVKRVAEYSKLLAVSYGLDEEEAELLKQASPMHDIGKVAIPDAVLNKPGRFNAEERLIMDTHAQLGYDMLHHSERPLLKAAAIVAHQHHEKYDGSGYPQGLQGEGIHIYGRITAVADVFDALGSDRVYKKAWDDERIFSLFKEERGKHFDPKLIDLFFENLEHFLKIRDKFKDV